MESEQNALGETYYWEYTPAEMTAWEDADKAWDSPGANQPWDTYGNTGNWTVSTNRTLYLTGEASWHGERTSKDFLSLIDANLENSGTVLSDVEISTENISEDEFAELAKNGSPIGYDNVRPLYPGEYTYEKAIVGLRMRSYELGITLGFYKAILNVDVEDIICRGTVEVTSTDISNPTKVRYQKWYYNAPEELMFSISNFSEPCHVKVLTKTDKEFTFMLESTVNSGTYVTGTVSWLAVGY